MGDTIGSIAGGLLGSAAGASSGPASVGTYYPNIGQNGQSYQALAGNNIANANTLQSTAAPAALNNYNTASNNPYAAAFQTGAGNAGQAYSNAGNSAINNASGMQPGINNLNQYAQQVMQMGLDPQNALYQQQRQGATDTANATNAGYGLTGPYAAGNTNQATQNFDMNWQNNALQRALSGLQGGEQALTSASGLGTAQNALQSQGAGDLYTGTGLPYNTAQGISQNQNVDLNNLITNMGGINNIDSNTMSSLLQYLSQGSGYGLQANAATNQAAANGAAGGSSLGGDIGSLVTPGNIMAAASFFSDKRLKQDIKREGKENGVPVYSFAYIWDKTKRYVGVMAQDILGIDPSAVSESHGFYVVNYDKLGVKFREI